MSGATDRAGARWERRAADHAQKNGIEWDIAKQRGRLDLLDLTGCIGQGWLIGCKAIHRGVPIGTRMWEAMDQANRAMANLAKIPPGTLARPEHVIPFQLLMRPRGKGSDGSPGKAYAVTEYDYLLELARLRAEQGW